jgi:hypothetical protein
VAPFIILMFLAGFTASGCGAKGDVSGQVKVNGEPLPSGRITFQVQEGKKEVLDSLIRNGSYEIPNVPTGEVKVKVESFQPRQADLSKVPKDLGIKRDQGDPSAAEPGKYIPILPRYADFAKSGLSYVVTKGPQSKDFDLEADVSQ